MSPAEQQPSSQANADQPIETVYTTVAAQHDRTDWLTVVSNLRQVNRQLVEEIARLEQALASAKQTLHNQQEANQAHEITILQQQDELNVACDRVGALFQQLESSHQIGQRQQTLIETLSQQLEIVQTIVPQLEAEHDELRQKYQQQSQKLAKTEQVAVELHRRLKLHTSGTDKEARNEIATDIVTIDSPPTNEDFDPNFNHSSTETVTADRVVPKPPIDAGLLETTMTDWSISTAEIDPAPPVPVQVSQRDTSSWMPPSPIDAPTSVTAATASPQQIDWREAILQDRAAAAKNYVHESLDPTPDSQLSLDTVSKESIVLNEPSVKSSPNWPSITLDRQPQRGIDRVVKIDLPKFPKKQPD